MKIEFTDPNQILEFVLYINLNKNWKIYWSEQSFTGLELEDYIPVGLFDIKYITNSISGRCLGLFKQWLVCK